MPVLEMWRLESLSMRWFSTTSKMLSDSAMCPREMKKISEFLWWIIHIYRDLPNKIWFSPQAELLEKHRQCLEDTLAAEGLLVLHFSGIATSLKCPQTAFRLLVEGKTDDSLASLPEISLRYYNMPQPDSAQASPQLEAALFTNQVKEKKNMDRV